MSMVGPVSAGDVVDLLAVKLRGASLTWASLRQVVVNDAAGREWRGSNAAYRAVRFWVSGGGGGAAPFGGAFPVGGGV